MENRESFVLIKPDGLESKEIVASLIEKIKENDIEIIDKNKMILRYEDVLTMWPAYVNCYISKKLLGNYLANKEVEVWRVTGDHICAKLNRVKKEIRATYGKGCIANCIHTPFDNEEAKWQYLYINMRKVENISARRKIAYREGLFGKMLSINSEVLNRAIDDVMEERKKNINRQIVISECNSNFDNCAIISLLNQTDISIDYAVSVLMEVFEHAYSLKDIINIILDVDLYGKRKLLIADYDKINKVKDKLVKIYKLEVCIEKIVRI